MTGLVERSSSKYVNFQTTHLAFVRRSQHHDHHIVGQQDSNKSKHFNSIFSRLLFSFIQEASSLAAELKS
jgi:hypothetical protein